MANNTEKHNSGSNKRSKAAIGNGDQHRNLLELKRRCELFPAENPLVFISYSWADRDQVDDQILSLLKMRGIEYFIDRKRIPQSNKMGELRRQIEVGIAQSDSVVIAWSAQAARSNYVRQELCTALAMIRNVIPVSLDETPVPEILKSLIVESKIVPVSIGDKELLAESAKKNNLNYDRVKSANRNARIFIETAYDADIEMVSLDGGLLKSFSIGKYPITQAQWKSVIGMVFRRCRRRIASETHSRWLLQEWATVYSLLRRGGTRSECTGR